ncbi:methyltransferase domain-containing protein [Croceibacterium sp. TMG7-5b_MA50]|uniref:methyltransferase domain-containing protein n=1 Tax=Croceibacterium sp. TMG7-5b_MA50 TaxID=3121290 RepID=UPI003221ACA9
MSSAPPIIFEPARRHAARARAAILQAQPNAARFVLDDMVEDVIDRIGFLRHPIRRALVIGDRNGALAAELQAGGAEVVRADAAPGASELSLAEEAPFPAALVGDGFDLIASLSALDTVNDLPGALIHMRRALVPGGLMLASFAAAGSLPVLRAAMLTADGDRPAARIHPGVDVRSGAQLLQRAGFADPVADSRTISVGYRAFDRLVTDLRAQALGSVLANPGPALNRAALARARAVFLEQGDGGRTVERFELVTLSGRRPS